MRMISITPDRTGYNNVGIFCMDEWSILENFQFQQIVNEIINAIRTYVGIEGLGT